MAKNRCYPRYSYIVSFALAGISLIFSLVPIFFKTNLELYILLIWSLSIVACSISFFISALISMQYYEIKDGRITIKSIFGTINSLELSNCFLTIQKLPTFFSRSSSTYKLWLCVYLKNSNTPFFTKGCNNKKKFKRIQIIYTENNSSILSQYLESDIKKYLIN